jgi:hypothetical protein
MWPRASGPEPILVPFRRGGTAYTLHRGGSNGAPHTHESEMGHGGCPARRHESGTTSR